MGTTVPILPSPYQLFKSNCLELCRLSVIQTALMYCPCYLTNWTRSCDNIIGLFYSISAFSSDFIWRMNWYISVHESHVDNADKCHNTPIISTTFQVIDPDPEIRWNAKYVGIIPCDMELLLYRVYFMIMLNLSMHTAWLKRSIK